MQPSQETTHTIPSSQRCEPGSVNIPVAAWPPTVQDLAVDANAVANRIIESLNQAILQKDFKAAGDLFHEDAYWRDHLALSWHLRTLKGRDTIVSELEKRCPLTAVNVDRTSTWRSPQVAPFNATGDVKGIQFYTTIETEVGSGRGIVRLVEKENAWKVWTFYTALTTIRGHEEPAGSRRPLGVQHGVDLGRKNWLDRRVEESNFDDRDPDVLIIGELPRAERTLSSPLHDETTKC